MEILIAVDGSAATQRMLDVLGAHDDWLGPQHRFTVLHGVPAIPHRAAAFLDSARARALYAEDAESVFKPVRAFFACRPQVPVRFVHRIGPAGPIIARYAQGHGVDLIVLGSHGHGAAAGLVLGSVAAKVLSLCRVPVLLLR